ncbi:hypothetical protein TraAM80_08360 [Trypanosoma rangeli]|uniref:CW-type domain-containing protein n=1 Tax=Trypanosoma rangeli TaxID=5698 RepID=A0A3R7KEY8_TRYRA|nr:uncharacterized protein TraAM80_08360 [Trypanosoma rangeli]RNE99133.1 hypothetical protein TraAM80_08360 [Trypanosoma rangeli]|eukprot:RNE99133.1 hypothetical protein TraAM80_08360 [Trypanosoma rangeli]
MAARSLQSRPGPSTLWGQFMAADVTHTFHMLFAEKLSTVSDRREFSTRLTALMRQWRAEHWRDIFIGAAAKRGGGSDGDRCGGMRRADDREEDSAAAAARRWERGVAMYYESIRVQRLMDEVLFFQVSEADELELDKLSRRESRRRRGLVRAVDEVWCAGKAAADFLLPVTEREAPLYYRRVRRPVCVASIYCSVWEGEVEDYAGLKVLLTLMRSNCELYNGGGSPLVAACQELVSVGFRAAREAQADEEEEAAAANGCSIGVAEGGDSCTRFPPRTEAELAWMFPPRREADQLPVDSGCSTAAAGRGEGHDAGETKRVLRLIRRSGAQETTAPAHVEPPAGTATTRRLTLRRGPAATPDANANANANADVAASFKKNKKAARNGTAATPRRGRKKLQAEKEVTYWMCCDLCDNWCIVPEKPDPMPEHWDCSIIGRECAPPKAKQKGDKPLPTGQKKRPGEKKTRGEAEVPEQVRAERGRRNRKGVAEKQAGDEPTLLQEHVAKLKHKNVSCAAAPRKRHALPSPSFSFSSSSSSSSSSSASSSSGLTGSSSGSPDTQPRRRRGRKPVRALQRQQQRRDRKRPRATRSSSWNEESSSDDDDGTPQPLRAVKAEKPPLTVEKLVELEAAMGEVEVMPVDDQNPVEILARLRSIEKLLR